MKTPSINSILRANPRNSASGAPMGDNGYISDDQPTSGLLCQRVNFMDGDYAPDGTYWGDSAKAGAIYAIFNNANSEFKPACGLLKYYRAHSRKYAIEQFKVDFPDYTFSRG